MNFIEDVRLAFFYVEFPFPEAVKVI